MLIVLLFFSISLGTASGQQARVRNLRIHTPIDIGASWMTRACLLDDGRAVVVGDLGRVGLIDLATGGTQWDSVDGQPFLCNVASRGDSIAVVGDHGAVFTRVGNGAFQDIRLPDTSSCRAVCFREEQLIVVTRSGEIWSRSFSGEGEWAKEYSQDHKLAAVSYAFGRCVAVGDGGSMAVWSDSDRVWSTVYIEGQQGNHGSVLIAKTHTVVGSDSGRVFSFNHNSGLSTTSRLMLPVSTPYSDDINGRYDRTLSLQFTSDGRILATGNYFPSVSGVYESSDTGRTFRRRSFDSLNIDSDEVNATFCPLVGQVKSRTFVLACTFSCVPLLLSQEGNQSTWRVTPIRGLFQFFNDTDKDTLQPYSESVSGLAGGEAEGDLVVVLSPRVNRYENLEHPDRRSIIYRTIAARPNELSDTLAVLPGTYFFKSANRNHIICGGDSAHIAISSDYGASWQISTIDTGLIRTNWSGEAFIVDSAIVCNRDNRLFYAPLSSLSFRELTILPTKADVALTTGIVRTGSRQFSSLTTEYRDNIPVARFLDDWVANSDSTLRVGRHELDVDFTNVSTLYSDGETAFLAVRFIDETNDYKPYQFRCHVVNGILICDTMTLQSPLGVESTLQLPNRLDVRESNGLLLGYSAGHERLVSRDMGRSWMHVPLPKTGFSGEGRTIANIQNRVHIGGGNRMHFSFVFDTTTSTVESFESDAHEMTATQEFGSWPPYPASLYRMNGELVRTISYGGHIAFRDSLRSLPTDYYMIVWDSPLVRSRIILISSGSIVAFR